MNFDFAPNQIGPWHDRRGKAYYYVRADIVLALQEEVERLRASTQGWINLCREYMDAIDRTRRLYETRERLQKPRVADLETQRQNAYTKGFERAELDYLMGVGVAKCRRTRPIIELEAAVQSWVSLCRSYMNELDHARSLYERLLKRDRD